MPSGPHCGNTQLLNIVLYSFTEMALTMPDWNCWLLGKENPDLGMLYEKEGLAEEDKPGTGDWTLGDAGGFDRIAYIRENIKLDPQIITTSTKNARWH